MSRGLPPRLCLCSCPESGIRTQHQVDWLNKRFYHLKLLYSTMILKEQNKENRMVHHSAKITHSRSKHKIELGSLQTNATASMYLFTNDPVRILSKSAMRARCIFSNFRHPCLQKESNPSLTLQGATIARRVTHDLIPASK